MRPGLDLTPREIVLRRAQRRRLMAWCVIAGAAACLGTAMSLWERRPRPGDDRGVAEVLRAQRDALAATLAEQKALMNRLVPLQREADTARVLGPSPAWDALLVAIARAAATDPAGDAGGAQSVVMHRLDLRDIPAADVDPERPGTGAGRAAAARGRPGREGRGASGPAASAGGLLVELDATAPSIERATAFVVAIESFGLFNDATLKQAVRQADGSVRFGLVARILTRTEREGTADAARIPPLAAAP